MPFVGYVAEQPMGKAGMVVRTNRLNAEPGELIDASGVQFDQMGLRKEAGSELLDPIGLAGTPIMTGTYSTPVRWVGELVSYKGITGIAFVQNLGSGSSGHDTTKPFVKITIPVGGVPAGDLVVIGVGQSKLRQDLAFPTVAVVDSKGNTYASATVGSSVITVQAFQFYSSITTPLVAGDTITITATFPPSQASSLAVAADQYTNIQASPFTGFGNGASDLSAAKSVGPTPPLIALPSLLVDVDVAQAFLLNAALAAGSGFTARSTADNVTESFVTPVQMRMFSRVDTSSPAIIGLLDFNPQNSFLGAGTITTTKGSQTVTGGGTAFLTQVNEGDSIRISAETHRVIAVASNTSLTVAEPWFTTNVGSVYTILGQETLLTVTSDGFIYQEIHGDIDFAILKAGLSNAIVPGQWVVGGKENGPATARKAFWFSGRDPVQVVNGTNFATANIALPPADWSGVNQPTGGVFSAASNRLVGFGNINDPHRLYFSSATNHEDFTTSPLTLEVYSGIGDRLWAGVSFNGLLMVWKHPRGIFFIDDSDSSALILRRKSEALGCAPSPHAVLPIDDDVLFLSSTGAFHLLSAVDTMGGTRASDLSYRLGISRWLRDHINLNQLQMAVSVWYHHKKQAFFAVPSTGSFANDLVLKFDFGGVDTGQAVRFSYSRRDAPGALATRRDLDTIARPMEGEAGLVYLWDRDARNKAGAPYTGLFQLPFLDFSYVGKGMPECRTRRKNYEHVEFIFEPVAAGQLIVQPYVDGQARGTPLTFNPTLRRDRQRVTIGPGHTMSLIGSESTLNGDFSIDDIIVSYTVGDEDQSVGPR